MLRIEIRIEGRLDAQWSPWFDGLAVTATPEALTILQGTVRDHAALYGLIARLRDLGLSLRSVVIVEGSAQTS